MVSAFFDVNNVFFTALGYPMSYLEFFGTMLNITCVWLVARKSIWNWPISILGVVLFGSLFYQIRLYSDFIEQIYYLLTGFYGWYAWMKLDRDARIEGVSGSLISSISRNERTAAGVFILIGTIVLGYFMSRIDVLFPQWFPEAAAYPYLDALTTIMSFVAQWLLVKKRLENWYLWIVVDIIGIWLYYEKDVKFVSLLYLVFLVIATHGLFSWRKLWKDGRANASVPRKEAGAI